MDCVVDFSDQFSRLTLSERPNSLFTSRAEALQHLSDVSVRPSEFDSSETANSDSCRKPMQHTRSSSSGFSTADIASATVLQASSTDGAKCELSGGEVLSERQNCSSGTNQLFGTDSAALQQKSSGETSIPSVRSWAAVLSSSKSFQQSAAASAAVGSRSDQPKLSESLSTAKSTSVNPTVEFKLVTTQSWANKSTSHGDRPQHVSSDRCRDGTNANDRMSDKQSQSSAWIAVSSSRDRRSKSRSQTPRPPSDASAHGAGSHSTGEPKPAQHSGILTGKLKPGERGGIMTGKPKTGERGGIMTGKPKTGERGGIMTGKLKPGECGGILTGKLKPGECGGIMTGKPKPVEQVEITAAACSSQSKAATKQKKNKKKKKKLKASEAGVEERSSGAVEGREAIAKTTQLAPEFDDLNEFPSLFSLTTGSKKISSLQAFSSSSAHSASGIYVFSLYGVSHIGRNGQKAFLHPIYDYDWQWSSQLMPYPPPPTPYLGSDRLGSQHC